MKTEYVKEPEFFESETEAGIRFTKKPEMGHLRTREDAVRLIYRSVTTEAFNLLKQAVDGPLTPTQGFSNFPNLAKMKDAGLLEIASVSGPRGGTRFAITEFGRKTLGMTQALLEPCE